MTPAPEAIPGVVLTAEDQAKLDKLFGNWAWIVDSESSMPPVSPLVFRLLTTDRDAPYAVAEITEIVESDPIVTARLLGLSNSSAFLRAGKPIRDVRSAVLRLGVHNAFETTFTEMFGMWVRHSSRKALPDDDLLDSLWLEYLLTAFCTRELAATLRDPSHRTVRGVHGRAAPRRGFAGALLGGARADGALRALRATASARRCTTSSSKAHSGLGSELLRSWNAPRELQLVAGHHHDRLPAQELAVISLVYIADHLHAAVLDHESSRFQAHHALPHACFGAPGEDVTAALTALGLTDKVESIIERVAAQGERIETLARLPD
jgi:hypothetical protein